jgi:hypothetical protein
MLLDKKNRIILLLLGGIVAGFLIWNLVLFISRIGLVGVNITAVPDDSKITMDGKDVKPGKIYLKPGAYNFTASRQYFTTIKKKFDTNDMLVPGTLYLLPRPDSQEALDFLNKNPKIQQQREAASGVESNAIQKKLEEKSPITSSLPYENSHYKIEYLTDESYNVSYTVTLLAIINGPQDYERYKAQIVQYKQEALNYLQNKGVNIKKAKITFVPNQAN